MQVYTDLPGIQIYTGNFLDHEPGKNHAIYQRRQGMCFETQHYPDSIHHLNFPSPVYKTGQEYQSRTEYAFDWV